MAQMPKPVAVKTTKVKLKPKKLMRANVVTDVPAGPAKAPGPV